MLRKRSGQHEISKEIDFVFSPLLTTVDEFIKAYKFKQTCCLAHASHLLVSTEKNESDVISTQNNCYTFLSTC